MGKKKYSFHFKEILVLFSISLIKTIILQFNIEITNIFIASMAIIPPLVVIYGLLNLIKTKRRDIYIVIGHILVSLILFADLMYYHHFGFLPSIKYIPLLKVVPSVASSVAFMIEPINIIMLIDVIPIIIYYKMKKNKEINYSYEFKIVNRYTILIMVILFIINIMFVNGKSIYAYSNYGIYTYHAYDIINTISDNSKEALSKEYDIESIMKELDKGKNNIEDNKYRGIAKNRNIIMIQFESLQNCLIDKEYRGQELTPNLNKLIRDNSIYFDNYYQQVGPGNTSDAEFAVHNSIYPVSEQSIYKTYTENDFFTLPHLLKEEGYSTTAYHGYKEEFWNRSVIYPKQGIDDFVSLEDLNQDEIIGLGISDKSFYEQTLKKLKQENNPFYAFIITLTSHNPYKIPKALQKIDLLEKHEHTLFGNYLEAINYADEALGEFIEGLKTEGLYDQSIIIIYGDHSGLFSTRENNKENMTEFLNEEYRYDNSMNVPLIIHIPNSGLKEVNSIAGSHVDLFPTILNLLGLENNKGLMFGQDLNNAKEGFLAGQYIIPIGSFIDDEKIFIMSKDGIFENSEAWYLETKEPVDLEMCREGYEKAIEKIEFSKYILEKNSMNEIMKKKRMIEKSPQ